METATYIPADQEVTVHERLTDYSLIETNHGEFAIVETNDLSAKILQFIPSERGN